MGSSTEMCLVNSDSAITRTLLLLLTGPSYRDTPVPVLTSEVSRYTCTFVLVESRMTYLRVVLPGHALANSRLHEPRERRQNVDGGVHSTVEIGRASCRERVLLMG